MAAAEAESPPSQPCFIDPRLPLRSLKTEPDRSLLASVRDDRFKQLRICVWVYRHDSEIVQVGLRGDLLHVVRLGILDIDHILSGVLKPADQHKITKDPGVRLWRGLSAFCNRLSRLRNWQRIDGPWIGSRFDFLVRILRGYFLLSCCLCRILAAIYVRSIGP
jgi:hypothetical protein